MKEKSIILSSADVRAVLDGTKTQHRERMKTQPPDDWQPQLGICAYMLDDGEKGPDFFGAEDELNEWCYPSPWGGPGDMVWVKETFCLPNMGDLIKEDIRAKVGTVEYAADMGIERFPIGGNFTPKRWDFRWRPSVHMPREASRLTLEITGVSLDGPPWEWVYDFKVDRSDKR